MGGEKTKASRRLESRKSKIPIARTERSLSEKSQTAAKARLTGPTISGCVELAMTHRSASTCWFGQWSPDPPGLCDRKFPSPRPLGRHLETSGQPNGGIWRLSPNETNSQRKQSGSEGGQDQLCSMPAAPSRLILMAIARPIPLDAP